MAPQEETRLLRRLIEEGDIRPLPSRREFSTPHYEVEIGIGSGETISIILSKEAYFELLEHEDVL